jgi:hypothetical protein
MFLCGLYAQRAHSRLQLNLTVELSLPLQSRQGAYLCDVELLQKVYLALLAKGELARLHRILNNSLARHPENKKSE